MKGSSSRRGSPDLDITPLIDILFMLILFFVLAATFDRGGLSVDLPRGTQRDPASRPFTLTVTPQGTILAEGVPVPPGEAARLAEAAARGGRSVALGGDRKAPYGVVAELLDALRARGVRSVGLLTRQGEVPGSTP